MGKASRELSTLEVETFSALLEESATTNKSFEIFFDEAARDRATLFRHNSECSAEKSSSSFARMNFNEMSALDAAAQSGREGLNTKPTIQIKLSKHENHSLCNVASFFGIVTEARAGKLPQPKPMSALRMMTTGDEAGRSFWGPNGVITKSVASMRAAIVELRALVARQAAAILRLLNHLATIAGTAAGASVTAAWASLLKARRRLLGRLRIAS